MESLTKFLEKKLKVNWEKSAVDRPWKRKFLGYSMTNHTATRPKVAPESVKRLKEKIKGLFRSDRGRGLQRTIDALTPLLRSWSTISTTPR